MKSLRSDRDITNEQIGWIRSWLAQIAYQDMLRVQNSGVDRTWLGVMIVMLAMMGWGLSVSLLGRPGHPQSPHLWWAVAYALCATLAFPVAGILHKRDLRRREKAAREEIAFEHENDPLHVRAHLILRAVEGYNLRCAVYREYKENVDKDLIVGDEEAANRYHENLTKARETIMRAIDNLEKAKTLHERQQEFEKLNPKHAERLQDTALSDLMINLNQSAELPAQVATTNLRVVIDHEDELKAIADELSGESLSARIEALKVQRG